MASKVLLAMINCLHDGYPSPADGTKCICRDGLFTGTRCEKRIIKNDGILRIPPNQTAIDMGAICPPGFIGANCQPGKYHLLFGESSNHSEMRRRSKSSILLPVW